MIEDVIVVVGATASGKSSLAIELAKALDGEVVSADSMQIYKGMDIGTAKVTKEEMQNVTHHMIDICEPTKSYSVNDFVSEGRRAIDDIKERGKTAVVAGGTGLYVDCLMGRMALDAPKGNEKIRRELTEYYEKNGQDALYELYQKECASDRPIHKNDIKRVIRAIEKSRCGHRETKKSSDEIYKSLWFAIDIERDKLYNRIDKRVDIMFEQGLLDEVRNVILPQRDICTTSLQGIGYKEVLMYLDGNASLDEVKESIKKGSRHYAKRQLTWFRRNDEIHWLGCENPFVEAMKIIVEKED